MSANGHDCGDPGLDWIEQVLAPIALDVALAQAGLTLAAADSAILEGHVCNDWYGCGDPGLDQAEQVLTQMAHRCRMSANGRYIGPGSKMLTVLHLKVTSR